MCESSNLSSTASRKVTKQSLYNQMDENYMILPSSYRFESGMIGVGYRFSFWRWSVTIMWLNFSI